MRALLLLLAILAFPLAGCDSGGDDEDDDGGGSNVSCQTLGLIDGSVSGSATNGTVSANCFSVETSGGLQIIAFDVPSLNVTPRTTVLLRFDEAAVGTYSVGNDEDRSFAQYSPSGTNSFDAASGTIAVTEFSASRVRGTFDFRTVNNINVTGGTFDVEL